MRSRFAFAALLCVGSLLMYSGCSKKPAAPAGAAGAHAHSHGPNEGELIEVGNDEYHAELVLGENNIVTIFVLDKDAKKPVPIAAEPITINMVVNSSPVEFTLSPKPLDGEAAGQSSRFESKEPNLGAALQNAEAKRELRLKIGEKAYVAPFPHFDDHGHPEHK
jgi:hypothetical protein